MASVREDEEVRVAHTTKKRRLEWTLPEVLPTHPTRLFADWSVALLSCPGDGRFLVANLRSTYDLGQYALDLFDSGSGTWSTRSMHTEPPHEDCY
uniref:Uncharacterized protein n=1 Tax=Aegilops tauschii TaxID=37682 RepID=N1QXZ9_AEGTA